MRTTLALATAIAIAAPLPAMALSLSYAQVQDLSAALNALDAGSPDQCPADTKGSKTCHYELSGDLLVTMAQDMEAIKGPMAALGTMQNALRQEMLASPRLKNWPNGCQVSGKTELACVAAQNEVASAYAPKFQDLADRKVQIAIQPLPLARLDIGAPPAKFHLSATLLAQLSPLLPWMSAPSKP
jgi:hypothetical protein